MHIKHNLLPKQKRRKYGLNVDVELFPLATELYEELDRIGMISRLRNVKQLGNITVRKQLEKSRYDYVVLQLYLHQMLKSKINKCLKYSYGNYIKACDLASDPKTTVHVTIYDAVQLLTLVYNIGHFSNTFVASRSMAMLAVSNEAFQNEIISCITNKDHQGAFASLLQSHNYQRVHLINSYLILEACDSEKPSVKLAKELIHSYLCGEKLDQDGKLTSTFQIYRTIRTMGFIAYDLQVSAIPFSIDLWDQEGLSKYFREVLAEYNNGRQALGLMESVANLLDASLYNEPARVICSSQMSKKMISSLLEKEDWEDYLHKYFLNLNSEFNQEYQMRRDFNVDNILKITFERDERSNAERLYQSLDGLSNTRAGFYLRHDGRMTILLSVRKTCDTKRKVALRSVKLIVACLRSIGADVFDERYILTVKFLLYYIFAERRLEIKPVTNPKKCVICTKGKQRRIVELSKLMYDGTEDQQHEVKAMMVYLQNEQLNDIAITVPGSTIVYGDDGKTIAEFDGIVIFPNRKQNQIVLIEAKNTKRKPGYGKNCLLSKLTDLGIGFNPNDIKRFDHDAYYRMTV